MATMIYRLCDINSTNPPPILANNRNLLNKMCLKSVVKAYEDIEKLHIKFILDNCEKGWIDWLDVNVPFTCEVIETNRGINDTYLMSLEIAKNWTDDLYIFQECDYLYSGKGEELLDATALGFVSPYDHPDKYPGETKLTLRGRRHWRTATSTTMTFACTRADLMNHYDDLIKYGYLDQQMWENLPAQLWTPIPSIATHMVKDFMAPNVNWQAIWSAFL